MASTNRQIWIACIQLTDAAPLVDAGTPSLLGAPRLVVFQGIAGPRFLASGGG
ncbi:MAG: hypothetical protein ISN28_00885 [Ectothiorhodospiraceae bacterium AqS1]|nr:hypothetical protein [Ectothiorhodospiraceae bacterium AqS1]